MILVVGATGLLGGRICRSLIARGKHVRALVREGSPGAEQLRALGVETVAGDLRDRVSLDAACRNVTAVITTANAVISRKRGDSISAVDRDGHLALIRVAREAGVRHFIYTSVSPALPSNNPFVRVKRQIEDAVRASGMTWTILQPAAFMDVHLGTPLGWDYVKGGARIMGSPTLVKSYVAVDDVAEFAVRSVDLPSAANRTLHFTGPEALSAADALAIAERITGRPFKVQQIPAAALRVISLLVRPISPGAASLTSMAAASSPDIVEMKPLADEFGVTPTPFSEYVRAQLK